VVAPSSRRRRALVAAVTAVLLVSTVGAAGAEPTQDPTRAAAGWLASQFADGERLEGEFGPDAGLTADAVIALAGAGVAAPQASAAAAWLAGEAPGYTQGQPFDRPDAVYAGATAKLILALLTDGRSVTDAGGVDLVAQLQAREQGPDAGSDAGRFTDVSEFGEFSSTLTQALAVTALVRVDGTGPSDAAVGFLIDQQCEDGGFRFDPAEAGCTSSADTTGFAVQALVAAGTPAATNAAAGALTWLRDVQTGDGAIEGNANATGLAAVAFAVADGEVAGTGPALAAAREFLVALQLGCESDAPGAIAFTRDENGDLARATAQAIPGLTGVGLLRASTSGASAALPALDCPTGTDPAVPSEPGEEPGEEPGDPGEPSPDGPDAPAEPGAPGDRSEGTPSDGEPSEDAPADGDPSEGRASQGEQGDVATPPEAPTAAGGPAPPSADADPATPRESAPADDTATNGPRPTHVEAGLAPAVEAGLAPSADPAGRVAFTLLTALGLAAFAGLVLLAWRRRTTSPQGPR
jgi:hypothetical protein